MRSFTTQVHGIACQCQVTHYRPYVPAKVSGPPEDCYPAEPAEFDFALYIFGKDAVDYVRSTTLEASITDEDIDRLQDEYEAFVLASKHGEEF